MLTLKTVGRVDVDVAVGDDVDVVRDADAEVDDECGVGVDVEVCVDVDGDAGGDVELGWRGCGGTPFFRRGGHNMRDHETREAFSNKLRNTIDFATDLINLFYVVEITGDQQ